MNGGRKDGRKDDKRNGRKKQRKKKKLLINFTIIVSFYIWRGYLDFGSGDPGSILGRVGVFISLSKRHLLPKSTGNTQE